MAPQLKDALAYARYICWRAAYRAAVAPQRVLSPPQWDADLDGARLFPVGDRQAGWILADESWDLIQNRWKYRAAVQQGRSYTVRSGATYADLGLLSSGGAGDRLDVRRPGGKSDRWFYAYLDPSVYSWGDFCWAFDARIKAPFQEFQLGFRYVDFHNRYRIRYEGGRFSYDIVRNGRFFNDLERAPFRLNLGATYRMKLCVTGSRFSFWVDDTLVLVGGDPTHRFPRGSIAVILWESRDQPEISAEISNIRVVGVTTGSVG